MGIGLEESLTAAGRGRMLTGKRAMESISAVWCRFILCRYVGEYSSGVKQGKGREELPNGQ
jgi:hypothetical protein